MDANIFISCPLLKAKDKIPRRIDIRNKAVIW
jgi:hypothetical protein